LVEEYATELKIIDPIILKKKPFSFPIGTRKITDRHKKYLINRNFDPEQIEKDWGILGTGSIGEYKFRIVIPIYFNGKIVSFQCRDITDRQVLRYKACEKEKEIIHHKNILYGLDHIQKSCIVVEGITDVWRFGRGAVCTFGTGYTKNQLYLLSNYVEQVFIFFDTEDAAQQHADRLAWELSILHVQTEIITVPFIKDPAELKQKDADYLKKDLLKI
jgi:DNA primase